MTELPIEQYVPEVPFQIILTDEHEISPARIFTVTRIKKKENVNFLYISDLQVYVPYDKKWIRHITVFLPN